jgi:hypothetical protein
MVGEEIAPPAKIEAGLIRGLDDRFEHRFVDDQSLLEFLAHVEHFETDLCQRVRVLQNR